MKKFLDRIFIDGLTGMAQGLFATLIIGTIIQQIGTYCGGNIGDLIFTLGKVAAGLTGAGIGAGVARKLDAGHLVIVSAAVVGLIGAFAGDIMCVHRDRASGLWEDEAGYHPDAAGMHCRRIGCGPAGGTADLRIHGMARFAH